MTTVQAEEPRCSSLPFVISTSIHSAIPSRCDTWILFPEEHRRWLLKRCLKEIQTSAIEGRVEDDARSTAIQSKVMILNVDRPDTVARGLTIAAETNLPVLGYLLICRSSD